MRAQFGGLDDLSPTSEETLSLHEVECGSARVPRPVGHAKHIETSIGGQTRELVSHMSNTIRNTHRSLKRSRLIHILYIVLLFVYTLIGAILFQHLDGEEHDARIADYLNRCRDTKAELETLVRVACNANDADMLACRRATEMSLTRLDACFHSWHASHTVPTMSMSVFVHAMFYAFSVYTTIGYGNVACESSACRHGTTVYAIVGIPLFFAFLHEISNLMGQTFMRAWVASQETKKRVGRWRRSYTLSARRGGVKGQPPQVFVDACHDGREHELVSPDRPSAVEDDDVDTSLGLPHSTTTSRAETKRVLFEADGRVYRRSEGDCMPLPTTRVPHRPAAIVDRLRQQSTESAHKQREQRRVFVGAIITFVVYLVSVSALMAWMEGWSFTDAFYFLFTSVALIGFGDVFPERPAMVLINCAFIVFGIALFGMCYFILQEEIRVKASQATRHARRSISRYRMAIQHRFTPSPSGIPTRSTSSMSAVKRRLSAPALAVRSRVRRPSPNSSTASGSPLSQQDRISRSVNAVNHGNGEA